MGSKRSTLEGGRLVPLLEDVCQVRMSTGNTDRRLSWGTKGGTIPAASWRAKHKISLIGSGGRVLIARHPLADTRGKRAHYTHTKPWGEVMTSQLTPDEVANQALGVLSGVLLHQRGRWGPLLGHGRQYEGWWKAEMAMALESWCWRHDLPSEFGVYPEAKPRDYGLGDTSLSVDLLLAPWGRSPERDAAGPRVWIELKERSWWWGNAGKALGTANKGLRHDLDKWKDAAHWTDRDVLLVCQITSNDGLKDDADALPAGWREELKTLSGFADAKETSVGYPISDISSQKSGAQVRWVTLTSFRVHPLRA